MRALETGRDKAPPVLTLGDRPGTAEMRHNEAEMLGDAFMLERQAVAETEPAVASLQAP